MSSDHRIVQDFFHVESGRDDEPTSVEIYTHAIECVSHGKPDNSSPYVTIYLISGRQVLVERSEWTGLAQAAPAGKKSKSKS